MSPKQFLAVLLSMTSLWLPPAASWNWNGGGSTGSSQDPCANWDCQAEGWSYEGETGPDCWSKCYPTCGGSSQSPVDLQHSIAKDLNPAGSLVMTGQERCQTVTFKNNGHSAQGDLSFATSVSGLGLPGTYKAQQFHFHWGAQSDRGSEHTMFGTAFPLELHIVHYSANYSDFNSAADKPNGLGVLSFLFEISSDDNPNYQDVISGLQNIQSDGQSTQFKLALDDLFNRRSGADLGNYFRYYGSLTTPPCTENVVWTVFTDKIPISENQIQAFRQLYEEDGSTNLYDNFRPLQILGNRILYDGTVS